MVRGADNIEIVSHGPTVSLMDYSFYAVIQQSSFCSQDLKPLKLPGPFGAKRLKT